MEVPRSMCRALTVSVRVITSFGGQPVLFNSVVVLISLMILFLDHFISLLVFSKLL